MVGRKNMQGRKSLRRNGMLNEVQDAGKENINSQEIYHWHEKELGSSVLSVVFTG